MKFRFVVVDDTAFIREIIKNIGESLGGACVGEGENGREAVELVKKTLPDLLFLDLVMPLKNGLEILEELKEIWPDLKIVACSTLDQQNIIDEARKKGVDHYLTKPFSKEEIELAIDKLILARKDQNHV
jgi:two-component system, chemotaxis family, chemotaxis protein CheY